MSSRAVSDSYDRSEVSIPEQTPSIEALDSDEVIRCVNNDGVLWYYARENGTVVLFHEWWDFKPSPRSPFSARIVSSHSDVQAAVISREELERVQPEGGEEDD